MTTSNVSTVLALSILSGASFLHSDDNRAISLDSLRRTHEGDLFVALTTTEQPGVYETTLFVCEARASKLGREGFTSIVARPIVGRANAAVREFTFTVSQVPSDVVLVRRVSDGSQGKPRTLATPAVKAAKAPKPAKAEKRATVSTPVQPERSVSEILTMVAELPEAVPAVVAESAPLSAESLVEGLDTSEPMASPLGADSLSADPALVVAEEPVQWINPALNPTTLLS